MSAPSRFSDAVGNPSPRRWHPGGCWLKWGDQERADTGGLFSLHVNGSILVCPGSLWSGTLCSMFPRTGIRAGSLAQVHGAHLASTAVRRLLLTKGGPFSPCASENPAASFPARDCNPSVWLRACSYWERGPCPYCWGVPKSLVGHTGRQAGSWSSLPSGSAGEGFLGPGSGPPDPAELRTLHSPLGHGGAMVSVGWGLVGRGCPLISALDREHACRPAVDTEPRAGLPSWNHSRPLLAFSTRRLR